MRFDAALIVRKPRTISVRMDMLKDRRSGTTLEIGILAEQAFLIAVAKREDTLEAELLFVKN